MGDGMMSMTMTWIGRALLLRKNEPQPRRRRFFQHRKKAVVLREGRRKRNRLLLPFLDEGRWIVPEKAVVLREGRRKRNRSLPPPPDEGRWIPVLILPIRQLLDVTSRPGRPYQSYPVAAGIILQSGGNVRNV